MLAEDQKNKIKELYRHGMLKKNIAKEINCSLGSVSKYTKGIEVLYDDMVGQVFGKLTVIQRAPKRNDVVNRCYHYICQCNCGKTIEVNGNALRTGHTLSCGCSRIGTTIIDLTRKKFGYLTALYLEKERNYENRAIWHCICDCGKEISVVGRYLIEGKVKSCGCMKESLGEYKIRNILELINIDYKVQYKIEDCRKIRPLFFDFAIFQDNKLICLIEYQGDIHFKSTGGWNTEEELSNRQERDKIKRQYCEKNNIKLIEIRYTEYNKIDENYLKGLIYGFEL